MTKQMILVGQSFTGKSTSLNILKDSLNKLNQEINYQRIESLKIYPKSLSIKDLINEFDQNNQ